jgi:hypothetical protein
MKCSRVTSGKMAMLGSARCTYFMFDAAIFSSILFVQPRNLVYGKWRMLLTRFDEEKRQESLILQQRQASCVGAKRHGAQRKKISCKNRIFSKQPGLEVANVRGPVVIGFLELWYKHYSADETYTNRHILHLQLTKQLIALECEISEAS